LTEIDIVERRLVCDCCVTIVGSSCSVLSSGVFSFGVLFVIVRL